MLEQTQIQSGASHKSNSDDKTILCVVINPPDDILQRAAIHDLDIDQVLIRFTRPRKLIARLPVQLLDGLEIVTHHDLVMAELNDAFDQFEAPAK